MDLAPERVEAVVSDFAKKAVKMLTKSTVFIIYINLLVVDVC